MIDAGYGDNLSVEELLARTEPLLQVMARERAGQQDAEDIAQEGRIALWEVASAKPEAPEVYVRVSAKMRMTEFATRGKATGAPSMRGSERPKVAASLDDPDVSVMVRAADALDSVLLAYHYGEIVQAINALEETDREYVYLRFWRGLSNAEIAAQLDLPAPRLERVWRQITKPRLQRMLHHLEGAAA